MSVQLAPEERLLARGFNDVAKQHEDQFAIYSAMYPSVRRITYQEQVADRHSFDYCCKRSLFVLVVPFTRHKEVLVERAFASNRLSWVLLGGSLRGDRTETFVDGANRHAARALPSVELGEIEPIAFLENTFTYKDQTHVHRGIAFVGRIRNQNPYADLDGALNSRGHFIPYDEGTAPLGLKHNEEVLHEVRSFLKQLNVADAPEFEVSENLKYARRYKFHDRVVKPLLRVFGRVGFRESIEDLEKCILELLQDGPHASVLDVACGENTSVATFGRISGVELVVGNDVSWSQIQLMSEKIANQRSALESAQSTVLFTNHDARRLPFPDDSFDFLLCKNVLHHMPDLRSVQKLVSEVQRVGKRALIVEVLDPQFESRWGRLRHRYYLDFLKDAGQHFLSREEFAALANPGLGKTFEVHTIRGIYQFAYFGSALAI